MRGLRGQTSSEERAARPVALTRTPQADGGYRFDSARLGALVAIGDLMSTDLVVVEPDSTVAGAATVMGGRHVGAALVMKDDSLVGIFTERDVLTALGSDFDAAGHLVSQWMSREPTTIGPEADAREALDLMLEGGYRHLPVVDDNKVVGVVSIRDLAPRD